MVLTLSYRWKSISILSDMNVCRYAQVQSERMGDRPRVSNCAAECARMLSIIWHQPFFFIAHRSLDYKEWFMKFVTVVNNVFGLYVGPIAWVNRHRLHHKNADHAGDPNKLADDGFWRTFYLCVMPYQCIDNMAVDEILRSRTFRVVEHPVFAGRPDVPGPVAAARLRLRRHDVAARCDR